MVKRKKNDYAPHVTSDTPPRCYADGCVADGIYKAPRDRSKLHDYQYFCLEHVREHNQKWDYFSGMNSDEIEAFMKDAVTGHRPTWERDFKMKNPEEKLYAALDEFLIVGRRKTAPKPKLSTKLQRAITLFEIDYPYTHNLLKKTYKELVKRTHPDRNPGDRLAEEKFKAVASAYKILEQHLDEMK